MGLDDIHYPKDDFAKSYHLVMVPCGVQSQLPSQPRRDGSYLHMYPLLPNVKSLIITETFLFYPQGAVPRMFFSICPTGKLLLTLQPLSNGGSSVMASPAPPGKPGCSSSRPLPFAHLDPNTYVAVQQGPTVSLWTWVIPWPTAHSIRHAGSAL